MLPRIPKLPLICMQEIKGEEEFFLKPMDEINFVLKVPLLLKAFF